MNKIMNVIKPSQNIERLCIAATITLILFAASNAYANCSGPAGVTGQIIYNDVQNVPQVCTNAGWVALGVLNPGAGGSGCTAPEGVEGQMIYNGIRHVPQYCDGDDWRAMIGFVDSGTLSGPSGCANIGDLCADGTVFAGWHPIFHEHLFIPPTNQGTTHQWKTATGTNDINPDSFIDGKLNHANRGAGTFPAFAACDGLNFGGHSDWYLPARAELDYLYNIRPDLVAKGNITNFNNAHYWSSTEDSTNYAFTLIFSNGHQDNSSKTDTNMVRCVRR